MMSRILYLLIGCVVLLLVSGCAEYEEKEVEIGYKGLARIDRFLAATRLVREMGLESGSYAGLPELPPPPNTVLCVPAGSLQNQGTLSELEDWMHYDGGHLICFLQLDGKSRFRKDEETYSFAPFLDFFGLEIDLEKGAKEKEVTALKFEETQGLKEKYTVEYKSPFRFRSIDAGEDEPFVHSERFEMGEGSMFVWSTAAPFANKNLKKEKHASLLWDMVNANSSDEVWFVYSTRISFWALLWEKFAFAICSGALLIFVSIWVGARRFGPIFDTVDSKRNRLDDHLTASGYFFAKHKADQMVIESTKKRMSTQLARRANLPIDATEAEILSACQRDGILDAEQAELYRKPFPESIKEQINYLQQLQAIEQEL